MGGRGGHALEGFGVIRLWRGWDPADMSHSSSNCCKEKVSALCRCLCIVPGGQDEDASSSWK